MRLTQLRRGGRNAGAPSRSDAPSTTSHASDATGNARHPVLNNFRQQSFATYVVTFSPRSIISLYFIAGLVLLPLGSIIVAGSHRIRSIEPVSYAKSSLCEPENLPFAQAISAPATNRCVIPFEIPKKIPAPSYLYYSLSEYYQNARNYARSLADSQLRGITPSSYMDVQNCEPLVFRNLSLEPSKSFNSSNVVNPCGLIAWSRFNDTFQLCHDRECVQQVTLKKQGIAWSTDLHTKFHPGPSPAYSAQTNALLQDEDFIVWMRLSAFSTFSKLYRIIEEDLDPGTYYMIINSSYPVQSFNGDKRFFISNTAWFGSRNYALGGVILFVGISSLLVAIILLIRFVRKPRKPVVEDPDRMLRQLAKLNLEYGATYQPGRT